MNVLPRLLTATGALVIAFALAEVALRQVGESNPVPNFVRPRLDFDESLGWKNRSGTFRDPAGTSGAGDIVTTVDSNGWRATAPAKVDRENKVVIAGCSFAFGTGVSDENTFAWLLQSRLENREVINLGVPAFSTGQTLLALRKYFENGGRASTVVYAFIDHHLLRNVMDPSWRRTVSAGSRSLFDGVPLFAWTLESSGEVLEHRTVYPRWWLLGRLRTTDLFVDSFLGTTYPSVPLETQLKVGAKLVRDMESLAKTHGSEFVLADVIWKSERALQAQTAMRREATAQLLDCQQTFSDDLSTSDHHLGPKANAFVANCIFKHLEP